MIRFLISRFGVKNVIGNTKYMDWKKWNGLQSLFEWSCSVWEDFSLNHLFGSEVGTEIPFAEWRKSVECSYTGWRKTGLL